MLVLARKVGEKIHMDFEKGGEAVHIEIVPVRVKGNGVRIGIEAPAEVTILREELVTANRETAPATQESVLAPV